MSTTTVTVNGTVFTFDSSTGLPTPGNPTQQAETLLAMFQAIATSLGTDGPGTVTSVSTGTGLTGGPVTSTGTIAIGANAVTGALFRQSAASSLVGNSAGTTANAADVTLGTGLTFTGTTLALGTSGVTAGTYTLGTVVSMTIDAQGRITHVA